MIVLLKDRIRKLREDRKLTQSDMAGQLSMSRLTYINIESGEKNPTVEQITMISAVLGVSPQSLLFPDADASTEQSKVAKYRQMALACIDFGGASDGKITKTKLAKLLYLVDFAWYRKTNNSMSGLQYRALPRGPVGESFFQMIDDMFESGQVLIEAKGAALMISANEKSYSNLSDQEISLIKAVCKKWQSADTQTLVELTHDQAPWMSAQLGTPISYELAKQIPEGQLY